MTSQTEDSAEPILSMFQASWLNIRNTIQSLYRETRPQFGESGFHSRVLDRLAQQQRLHPGSIVRPDDTLDIQNLEKVASIELEDLPVTTEVWTIYVACAYLVSAALKANGGDEALAFVRLTQSAYHLGMAVALNKGEAAAAGAAMKCAREGLSRSAAAARHAKTDELRVWAQGQFRARRDWVNYWSAAEVIAEAAAVEWKERYGDLPTEDPVELISRWIRALPDRSEFVKDGRPLKRPKKSSGGR